MPHLATILAIAALLAPAVHAAEPVGGRWSLEPGHDKPRFLFRDGDTAIDLFSYHQSDSNKDGTDEVQLRHEPEFLVIERKQQCGLCLGRCLLEAAGVTNG